MTLVVRPIWTKTCRVCSSQFQTRSNRKVTCSTACRMWSRSHPGQSRPDSHACPTCGGPVTKRAGTIYCSARCRTAAEKRRNRPIASEYQIFAESSTAVRRYRRAGKPGPDIALPPARSVSTTIRTATHCGPIGNASTAARRSMPACALISVTARRVARSWRIRSPGVRAGRDFPPSGSHGSRSSNGTGGSVTCAASQ